MKKYNVAFKYMSEIICAHECHTDEYINHGESNKKEKYFSIVYIQRGKWEFYIDNSKYILNENDCFVIMPGMLFFGKSLGKGKHSYTMVQVNDIFGDISGKGFRYRLPTVVHGVRSPSLSLHLRWCIQHHVTGDDLSAFGYFLCALENMCEQGENEVKNDYTKLYCNRALEYIDNNYMNDITLESISDAIGISPSYLSKIFKRIMKLPIGKHLIKCRLQKAKELILYDNISLNDIAKMTGFCSYSSFTRAFAKYEQMSPTDFKKKYRKTNGFEISKIKNPSVKEPKGDKND